MKLLNILLCSTFFLTSCSHTYYVVRHAEKVVPAMDSTGSTMMQTNNNPPLSAAGEKRAQDLKDLLRNKKIEYIFATNTIRARSTAEPIRNYRALSIQNYGPVPDSAFINTLRTLKNNVLIVGHSNTVDDIVNALAGKKVVPGDLTDAAYDNLFMVRYKKCFGTHIKFTQATYGAPAH